MRKIAFFICLFLIGFTVSGCGQREKLLLLNWGEYINDEIITMFEEKHNCNVILNIADSNELFYAKIKSGTTVYDLVIPSEYMVERMVQNDLLQKVDYSKLTNYDPVNNPYLPGVIGIQNQMFEGYEDYAVPYFWGTFGLMYNKKVNGLEEAVKKYGWKGYFEPELLPGNIRVGMYDVPRYAYAAAMFYLDQSPNVYSEELLKAAEQVLLKRKFTEWGTDTLKKGISSGNRDLAFVYTGDFLDMLYIKLSDGVKREDITFDIYIPNQTIAFMDTFVIPKKARHLDLAHKFIDFLLDPEIAYLNASVVGYCTPLQKSYEMIVGYEGDDQWLNDWKEANLTYYPLPKPGEEQFIGTPLKNFDRNVLNAISTMVNNVIVKNR